MSKAEFVTLIAKVFIRLPGKVLIEPEEEFPCPVHLVDGYLKRKSAVRPTHSVDSIQPASKTADEGGSDTPPSETVDRGSETHNDDEASGGGSTGQDQPGGAMDLEARNHLIAAVLLSWKEADPDFEDSKKWTQKKEPRNSTLDKELGFDVAKDEVTPIWASLKEASGGDADDDE
jgi:hypothetical protein